MGLFHEYLDTLATMGDTVALPEGFNDGITAAYDQDFSVPAAKVGVIQGELDAAIAEIATLKAQNYDLLMAIPTGEPAAEEDPTVPEGDENDGIDSLFGDEDKDDN